MSFSHHTRKFVCPMLFPCSSIISFILFLVFSSCSTYSTSMEVQLTLWLVARCVVILSKTYNQLHNCFWSHQICGLSCCLLSEMVWVSVWTYLYICCPSVFSCAPLLALPPPPFLYISLYPLTDVAGQTMAGHFPTSGLTRVGKIIQYRKMQKKI